MYDPEELVIAEHDLDRIHFLNAAEEGNMVVLRTLIGRVNVNSVDPRGWTALHLAVSHQRERAIRFLLEHGVNVNAQDFEKHGTPLLAAAVLGFSTLGILLLKAGADPNIRSLDGIVPLHFAAQMDLPSLTRELISRGANAEAASGELIRPLHYAAMGDSILAAEYLLKAGAQVDSLTRNGETAVHFCSRSGKKHGVLDVLLRAGADINRRSSDTFSTPLDLAIQVGNEAMVKWIEERGGVRSAEQRIVVVALPKLWVPSPGLIHRQ